MPRNEACSVLWPIACAKLFGRPALSYRNLTWTLSSAMPSNNVSPLHDGLAIRTCTCLILSCALQLPVIWVFWCLALMFFGHQYLRSRCAAWSPTSFPTHVQNCAQDLLSATIITLKFRWQPQVLQSWLSSSDTQDTVDPFAGLT